MTEENRPFSFTAPFTIPTPEPVPTHKAAEKIKAWQRGDSLDLTGVDAQLYNELCNTLKQDKKDRGYRFEYDQTAETLAVINNPDWKNVE